MIEEAIATVDKTKEGTYLYFNREFMKLSGFGVGMMLGVEFNEDDNQMLLWESRFNVARRYLLHQSNHKTGIFLGRKYDPFLKDGKRIPLWDALGGVIYLDLDATPMNDARHVSVSLMLDSRQKMGVAAPANFKDMLILASDKEGCSLSSLVRKALGWYIQEYHGEIYSKTYDEAGTDLHQGDE